MSDSESEHAGDAEHQQHGQQVVHRVVPLVHVLTQPAGARHVQHHLSAGGGTVVTASGHRVYDTADILKHIRKRVG